MLAPTTRPERLMPYAWLSVPPSVPRSVILPLDQRNAWMRPAGVSALAHDLAQRADAVGPTVSPAKCPQIPHDAVLPEEGMKVPRAAVL